MTLQKDKKFLWWAIVLLIVGIMITRLITLDHGMMLHVDEYIFYLSSSSLINGDGYAPIKAYPEGAFILQAPFQALRLLITNNLHISITDQEAGRFASIFYFSIGSALGCWIISQLSKRKSSLVFYAVIMIFALFQIEQSRYGTGDPPSFFLMMLTLVLLVHFFRSKRKRFLLGSAFIVGVMSAVKYPQLYFFVFPLFALLGQKDIKGSRRLTVIVLMLISTAVGFICFSPSVFKPGFLSKILYGETAEYLSNPNLWAVSTPLGHVMNLLLFHLFYADVPFAIVWMIVGIFALSKTQMQTDFHKFFTRVIPITFCVFFLYNLFIPSLFFRTYYLFFCVAVLYTAIGLGAAMQKKGLRIIALILMAVMVARGGYLIDILSQKETILPDHLETHELWYDKAAVMIVGTSFIPGHEMNGTVTKISSEDAFFNVEPEFESGTYVVTQPYQFALARSGLFPIANEKVRFISQKWKEFREYYDMYLYDKQYPDFYYYLFGYWLEGSTGTTYEFPTIYYYFVQ